MRFLFCEIEGSQITFLLPFRELPFELMALQAQVEQADLSERHEITSASGVDGR